MTLPTTMPAVILNGKDDMSVEEVAVPAVLGDEYGSLDLEYSFEPTPLGTGGALRHVPLDPWLAGFDEHAERHLGGFRFRKLVGRQLVRQDDLVRLVG